MNDHILWNVNAEDLVQASPGSRQFEAARSAEGTHRDQDPDLPGAKWSCHKLIFMAVTRPQLQGLGSKGQKEAFACFLQKLEQTDCLLEMIGRITPFFDKDRKENPGNYRL